MTRPVTAYRFLDPVSVAMLRDLDLAARTIVDGFMLGMHRSQRAGAGLEFSQYRSYQPGDDLRQVDWKLFGRSDRYFVREADTETSVTVRLLVDGTASMLESDGALTKFDYGRHVAAALALMATRQGDAVGLSIVTDGAIHTVRPSRGQQHLHHMLHLLEDVAPHGQWPPWERIETELEVGGRRGVTVVITDCVEQNTEIQLALKKMVALRHDVICLHITSASERDLPWEGPTTFEELETGRRISADPTALRDTYRARWQAAVHHLEVELEEMQVDYCRMSLDEPFALALRRYLAATARTR